MFYWCILRTDYCCSCWRQLTIKCMVCGAINIVCGKILNLHCLSIHPCPAWLSSPACSNLLQSDILHATCNHWYKDLHSSNNDVHCTCVIVLIYKKWFITAMLYITHWYCYYSTYTTDKNKFLSNMSYIWHHAQAAQPTTSEQLHQCPAREKKIDSWNYANTRWK